MSILIVDDEEPLLELLRYWLGKRPLRTARTMKEAQEQIAASVPEHIILDLDLPDSPPSETIRRIKEIKNKALNAVIIVITGFPEHERAAREGGCDRFVRKGYGGEGLFEELNAALFEGPLPPPVNPMIQMVTNTAKSLVAPKPE